MAHQAKLHLIPSPRLASVAIALLFAILARPLFAQLHTQSLAGEWQLSLEKIPPADGNVLPQIVYADTIRLPATTETAAKGALLSERRVNMLTPIRRIEGPVWYRRDVLVPKGWEGLRVGLFIERSKCSKVWLDSRFVGESSIFSAPQSFDLGTLAPGRHSLTICVDNSLRPIPGWGENHQITEHTQGNWNGLLGKIELRATDDGRFEDAQVFASPSEQKLYVRIKLDSLAGGSVQALGLRATLETQEGAQIVSRYASLAPGQQELSLPVSAPSLWDEFQPSLYRVKLELLLNGRLSDKRTIGFGFRDFKAARKQFSINGRTLFLRGKHEGCIFPLTGHPPMDLASWKAYFGVLAQYGINHVRFHSWTPPEAAFEAADELGFYLQPELPFWGTYNEAVQAAILPEGEAILRAYGNHPSFVMFSLGNENRGSRPVMASLVSHFRELDGRHLYAQGSNNFHWAPEIAKDDDYWTTGRLPTSVKGVLANVRGSFSTNDRDDGHVQVGPPSTMEDYSSAIAGVPMPVIGHEIGQYTVCPDYREIERYTGVFRAYNLEHFREKARAAGLLDRADLFFRASGKLAAINYREEVEAALRTPEFGGFQLLDLQDYPGQGTALIGLLNAFLESKGAITPEEWRRFCGPQTLLGRFERYTWTAGETANIEVELAHYGKNDLPPDILEWRLVTAEDRTLVSGSRDTTEFRRGGLRPVAKLALTIPEVPEAARVTLVLELSRAGVRNEYPLWIYAHRDVDTSPGHSTVVLARAFDKEARKALAHGLTVMLMPDASHPLARQVGGGFATDFWCWPMFKNTPGTMGLVCDPAHPALALFPTDFHSDYQWFGIALASQPVILDGLPDTLEPIVETIDNLERVHRLGLIFECKVGPGRLLVCAADLPALAITDRPARQLLRSLLRYAASPDFKPRCEIAAENLSETLRPRIPHGLTAASASEPNRGPARAIDNNDDNSWDCPVNRPGEWWREDFSSPVSFSALELVQGKPGAGYDYVVETSQDGSTWSVLAEISSDASGRLVRKDCKASGLSHLRIRIAALPEGGKFSLAEVRLLQ